MVTDHQISEFSTPILDWHTLCNEVRNLYKNNKDLLETVTDGEIKLDETAMEIFQALIYDYALAKNKNSGFKLSYKLAEA
tara:strand:+ start:703 stop:942 length:240 start_codon:yes stop_codon:yes gene_type:complete